jgi:LysR family glycine cleavage system transcriptional activator
LREGFAALAAATEMLHARKARETLTISVAPSFAVKWLARRIDRFIGAFPEIDARIAASPLAIDGWRHDGATDAADGGHTGNDADIEIRFGTGTYPGFQSEKLFSVAVTPICAPRFRENAPLRVPGDLRHHTLLHDDTLDFDDGRSKWKMWLTAAGVEGVDVTRGPHFNHAALALDAAADGVGIVLGYPLLAASDFAIGRRVMPFELVLPLDRAYYVVYREGLAKQRKTTVFRDWLFAEAKKFTEFEAPGSGRAGGGPWARP